MNNLTGRKPTLDLTPDTEDIVWSMIKKGMTQTEIGTQLGCSQTAVSNLINGRIKRVEIAKSA